MDTWTQCERVVDSIKARSSDYLDIAEKNRKEHTWLHQAQ